MSRLPKPRGLLLRLLILIGVVFTPLIPAKIWAFAQSNTAPLRIIRSLYTSEFGVNAPKGLAFSPTANTFFVLDGSANIALITMGEDNAGSQSLPESQSDPLNMAFDKKSDSLFVFNRGKSELVKIKADGKGLPNASSTAREAVKAFNLKDPQGIAFDADNGRLFILDAGKSQIVSVVPHPTLGFDADEAIRANKVQRISLNKLGAGLFRGLAYNPGNGHLYISNPAQKKLYELTQTGDVVSTFDLASLGINNPSAMTFAPSVDNTDDPNKYDLFILDGGQAGQTAKMPFSARAVSPQQIVSADGQIVELSLVAPASLPAGTTLLPSTLVRTFATANWTNPSPDTSGVDYWPPTGELLMDDSEVEEAVLSTPVYWHGFNIFQSTLAGSQTGNCTTFTSSPTSLAYNNFTNEPSGLAINPANNHVFITSDGSNSRVFEVGPGPDTTYCTADDTITRVLLATLYGAGDSEDVAYGNNTVFISDGVNAEVYSIPLGADGVLNGGGDDGPVTHFDTAVLGFNDLEGIGYNADAGTLFIVSTQGTENYLGEITTSGTLVHAYDLSFMGTTGNLRSDVAYAPSSQNAAVKSIYIVSRGVDNNSNPNANDGKVWEVNISGSSASTSTPTKTPTPTSTQGPTPTPTNTFTPTPTFTATSTPTATPTTSSSDVIFADGFESGNLSAWSSSTTDVGNLSVSAAAALTGGQGMQALINDNNSIYVTNDSPNAEPRYRARFYFDPNSITMLSGNAHFIFRGLAGTSTAVLQVEFRLSSGAYQIRARALNDSGTWINSSWFTITDASHSIEFDWRAASAAGANDGGLTLWIDGVQKANLTGVDNDTRRIDRVRLGAVAGIDTGTRGTYFFDAFESRRQTYIGP